jgi:hypothetical protein
LPVAVECQDDAACPAGMTCDIDSICRTLPPIDGGLPDPMPGFVQLNFVCPQSAETEATAIYTAAQTAGNTNILAIGWNSGSSNLTSVTDSMGNVYKVAVPTVHAPALSQAIYYASNIKAAAPGENAVTVTFDVPTPPIDLRITEYRDLAVDGFDAGATAYGTGTNTDVGSVTTHSDSQLLFAAGMTWGSFATAGPDFTVRIITVPDADIVQDRFVTASGTYNVTAPLNYSEDWLLQVATFETR